MRKAITPLLVYGILLCAYLPWSYCHPVDILSPCSRRFRPALCSGWGCKLNGVAGDPFPGPSEDELDFTGEIPSLPTNKSPSEEDPELQNLFVEEQKGGNADSRLRRIASAGKPTSLDLTFHLLRELMETSRSEKMSQKAQMNKKLLHTLGK
ncbi:corticoliberin-like [Alosa pseudoharengus]|uniref:corticoliberin-like n=1 Tax=Alosa pseudoharengus TaxID=34774 RepID=UPI003F8A5403